MLRRFTSGQRIRKLPTVELNDAINAARDRETFGFRSPAMAMSGQFAVDVMNDTGDDLDQWAAIGFDDPLIDPDDNEPAFRDGIGFVGVTPDHATHLDRFGVLLAPIPDGQVGRALLRGWLNCKVDVLNVEHQYVRPTDGAATLETCGAGGGRVIWPRPFTATGEQWATVELTSQTAEAFCYLNNDLTAPSVGGSPAVLTPATVNATIFDFNSSGTWANTADVIELTSVWENVSADENTLALARLIGSKWRLVALGCQASDLVVS